MISRILMAYDGSEPANKAFTFAVDLARKYQAALTVLAVSRPPEIAEDVETRAILENSRKHYRRLLEPLQRNRSMSTPRSWSATRRNRSSTMPSGTRLT